MTRADTALRYARRRALRILPGYWVALTLLAIFPGVVGVFTGDWWRYYGYLMLYFERTRNGGIQVAWTLCVEVTFYIALPVWAALLRSAASASVRRSRFLQTELGPLVLVIIGGFIVQIGVAHQQISSARGARR